MRDDERDAIEEPRKPRSKRATVIFDMIVSAIIFMIPF